MIRVLHWIADYWYIPLLTIGALAVLILWIIHRRGDPPVDLLNVELQAIKAGRDAREAKVELGAERAVAKVEADHKDAVGKLDADQRAQAEELRDDPVALARFLVRAGR